MYQKRILYTVLCLAFSVLFLKGTTASYTLAPDSIITPDSIETINDSTLDLWLNSHTTTQSSAQKDKNIKDSIQLDSNLGNVNQTKARPSAQANDSNKVKTTETLLLDSTKQGQENDVDQASLHRATIDSLRLKWKQINDTNFAKIQELKQYISRLRVDSIALSYTLSQSLLKQYTLESQLDTQQTNYALLSDSLNTLTSLYKKWSSDTPTILNNPLKFEAKSPHQLLSKKDSLYLHTQGIKQSAYNPMFEEWIYGQPLETRQKLVPLREKDYTLWSIRHKAKTTLGLEHPDYYAFDAKKMPKTNEIIPSILERNNYEQLRLRTTSLHINSTLKQTDLTSPWSYGGIAQLHTAQNYLSNNWYAGGESNLNFIIHALYELKYKSDKIQWDNLAQYDQEIVSAGSDSLRNLRLNTDLLTLQSKIGYKAYKNFYWTIEEKVTMPFFNMYTANTKIRTAAFAAPLTHYLSIGMDYKKDKLSIFFSPLSYKMVYINDTSTYSGVDASQSLARRYQIEYGHKASHQLGALLRVGYKHKIMNGIDAEHKFSAYGNYIGTNKGLEVDYKLTVNFEVNQFVSAQVILNPRYDTMVDLPDDTSPWMFKETISLGFSYKF